MLLKRYQKEISLPICGSTSKPLHCIAHLDQNIGEVLPYLNAVLGGDVFIRVPPAVTFKAHGKLITVYARMIDINSLRDEAEADHILEWMKQTINDTWKKRKAIIQKYHGKALPHILEIYKFLPQNNCRKCGQRTCMMFASLAARGMKGFMDCPMLTLEEALELKEYLCQFQFD